MVPIKLLSVGPQTRSVMAVENKKLKRQRLSRTGHGVHVERERLIKPSEWGRCWVDGPGGRGWEAAGQQLEGLQLWAN